MEYIDVLDKDGRATGQKAARSEVHKRGLWHKTVHVWVRNDRGELLLQKRALNLETYRGKWDIAVGGHVRAGDSSLGAAVRETREELNLEAAPAEFKFLFTVRSQSVENDNTYFNNEYNDVYLLERNLKTAGFRSEEVTAIKYITVDELKRMMDEHDDSIVPHWPEVRQLLAILKDNE